MKLVLLLVAATLLPCVVAQSPAPMGLAVTLTLSPYPIPLQGGPVNITVTAGCGLILAGGQSPAAQVTFGGDFNTTTVNVPFDPTTAIPACANPNAEVTSAMVAQAVVPKPGVPALTPLNLTAVAAMGTAPDNGSVRVMEHPQVAYRPCHSIQPDIAFPAQVTGASLTFNLTLTYCGNARSMIMFDGAGADHGASVEGLAPRIAQPPFQVRVPITFVAPTNAWTASNVTFRNYSHYLLMTGQAGTPQLVRNITWQFQNANPAGAPASSSSAKKSPDLGLPALVATVFLVALRRRR
ncbi:MAG: hypothetical protein ACYDBQ_04025 [Thermoplasmatota archaeon]